MPDWTDTLAARQRGEHDEFLDVNRPLEEQGDAGRAAAGLPPEPTRDRDDENPDEHDTVARTGAAGETRTTASPAKKAAAKKARR